jgi:CBS domain-containing protein
MNVAQLMTSDVKSCPPEDTLTRAAQIMWDNDCGCVPVVDDESRVVGIITDRDLAMAAYTQGRPLSQISVKDAMAHVVHCCRPDDPISVAERIMRVNQIRRLPVTDEQDHLVGILSLNDLAREAARERSLKEKEVDLGGVSLTLAAICEPRRAPAPAEALAEVSSTNGPPSTRRPGGRPRILGL